MDAAIYEQAKQILETELAEAPTEREKERISTALEELKRKFENADA
jgi:hypothetical protein